MEQLVNILQEFGFEILLTVILPFVAQALIALTKKWLAEIKNAKPQLFWYLEKAAEISVAAAEKMNLSEFISDKKQYAIEIAQSYLDAHGWSEVDIDLLEAAIESEVLKQFP